MRKYSFSILSVSAVFLIFLSASFINPRPLTLKVESKKAKSGKEVCTAISVKDFSKIVSLQYSINWDSEDLKFSKLQNFQLPGLREWSFGNTFIEKGILTFSWYDPSVRGITLSDETEIYEICFEVIGPRGTESPVKITEDPVSIEVTGASNSMVRLITEEGIMKIK